jgi:hypothetical protein
MATLQFSQEIVTPKGTPLGGRVTVDVQDNGDWHAHFEMHSSSALGDFDFGLRAYLRAPGFPVMSFVHSGHVSGVDSAVYDESGHSPLLALYWAELGPSAQLTASKSYTWGGVVGALEDIVNDVKDIIAGAAGAALGVVIGATKEALKLIGVPPLGPGATFGVIGGVVVFAITALGGVGLGGALIAGAVTAVTVCVIADLEISSRPLNDVEKQLARQVFGDTAPLDQVMLTNLGGASGRNFTAQGVDNKIYVNLGKAYSDPLAPGGLLYPYPGQVLIHELTHAWQISHSSFLPGLMCSMVVTQADYTFGDAVYAFGLPGADGSSFNPEQQAAIVDRWFGGNFNSVGYLPMDQQNIYYRYVWENILGRVSPPTAPANLRACTASPLASVHLTEPEEVDVYWAGGDGSVVNQASANGVWDDGAPVPVLPAGSTTAGACLATVTREPGVLDLLGIGPDAEVTDQVTVRGATQGLSPVAPAPAARADSPVVALARMPGGWTPSGSARTVRS